MPSPEEAYLEQSAVLWSSVGQTEQAVGVQPYDAYGQYLLAAPVSLAPPDNGVRWVGKRSEMTSPDGNPITLDAQVFCRRRIDVGSVLWSSTDPYQDSFTQFYGTPTYAANPGSGAQAVTLTVNDGVKGQGWWLVTIWQAGVAIAAVMTNALGVATFTLANGSYTVTAAFAGYISAAAALTVSGDTAQTITVAAGLLVEFHRVVTYAETRGIRGWDVVQYTLGLKKFRSSIPN